MTTARLEDPSIMASELKVDKFTGVTPQHIFYTCY